MQIICACESGSSKAEGRGGRHGKCPIYFPNYLTLLLHPGNQTFPLQNGARGRGAHDDTLLSYSEEQELGMGRVEK